MPYRIHYPEKPNMGDLLNKYMLEDLFHIHVERADALGSNMSAIGSGLYLAQWSNNPKQKLRQIMRYPFVVNEYHVWGTGFIRYADKDNPFFFRKMVFHSLRGELTKLRVEKIIGKKLDIPLADGGLLAERWVGTVPKKHAVGIIPHFKEKDHPMIDVLAGHYPDSIVIDLSGDPKKVVETIGACEYILSSSLHGLIVADSFHIPNRHILLYAMGERIMGDGYKYHDYYSSYGLEDRPLPIDPDRLPSIEEIKRDYFISEECVEKKKAELMVSFPTIE